MQIKVQKVPLLLIFTITFLLPSSSTTTTTTSITMITAFSTTFSRYCSMRTASGTTTTRAMSAFRPTPQMNAAQNGQAEVVLVGCGAPNRGMGWYHGIQMVEKK
jgi:hypothetical protein